MRLAGLRILPQGRQGAVTFPSHQVQPCPFRAYNTLKQWECQVRCAADEDTLEKVTNEEIRKAVEFFWSTFLAKSEEQLHSYYAAGSTVFQIAMGRSEPGRLGAMRRSREYFSANTRMELKLGPIDVVLIGNDAAVASYTFSFQASGRDVGGGKRAEEKLDLIRATHVFQRDAQGKMHILHEHFSVPVAG